MKSSESEVLTHEQKMRITKQIKYDIETGVYSQWPKLKQRLIYIGNKLFNGCYVVNYSEITSEELQTLKENDYLR